MSLEERYHHWGGPNGGKKLLTSHAGSPFAMGSGQHYHTATTTQHVHPLTGVVTTLTDYIPTDTALGGHRGGVTTRFSVHEQYGIPAPMPTFLPSPSQSDMVAAGPSQRATSASKDEAQPDSEASGPLILPTASASGSLDQSKVVVLRLPTTPAHVVSARLDAIKNDTLACLNSERARAQGSSHTNLKLLTLPGGSCIAGP